MELIRAQEAALDEVEALYADIIDHTADMARYARWKKGLHPTRAAMRDYIREGAMFLLMDGACIAGAMAVTLWQGEDYHAIPWGVEAADDEVAVLHLLGVRPSAQGKGVGARLVREALDIAREQHRKALRLDALESNLPARRLYEALGFAYRGQQRLWADNTGWTQFCYYERILWE